MIKHNLFSEKNFSCGGPEIHDIVYVFYIGAVDPDKAVNPTLHLIP